MLLTLDMGNTNITLGIFEGRRLIQESRLATDTRKMEDQYAVELLDILRLYSIDRTAFDGAILGSVVPPLNQTVCRAVEKAIGVPPMLIGPGIKTGLDIRIDNPAQLGADLLVGGVAAAALYGPPCIIWDLGTATKGMVIDQEGRYRGGVILPGVGISMNALVAGASLLPKISLEAPAQVIGSNTVTAMQSGVVYGTAALIEGLSDRMEEELGSPATLVATGGLGRDIAAACRRPITYDGTLLLHGLRLVYERNRHD